MGRSGSTGPSVAGCDGEEKREKWRVISNIAA